MYTYHHLGVRFPRRLRSSKAFQLEQIRVFATGSHHQPRGVAWHLTALWHVAKAKWTARLPVKRVTRMCLRSPKEYTIVGRSMGGEELARMQCEHASSVMSMSSEMKMTLGACF